MERVAIMIGVMGRRQRIHQHSADRIRCERAGIGATAMAVVTVMMGMTMDVVHRFALCISTRHASSYRV
jgi:hypothetical protein